MSLPSWFSVPSGTHPVGYAALILRYALAVPPPRRVSFVAEKHLPRTERTVDGRTSVTLPPQYDPGPKVADQLEFALKHEDLELLVLSRAFSKAGAEFAAEIVSWVEATPNSQYARRAWFLFEFLTGRELALTKSTAKSYVPLLDAKEHYTAKAIHSPRHRVANNLLGNSSFCPIVRRTEAIQAIAEANLGQKASDLIARYDPELLRRAVDYLYTKETRSTFKLEGEVPDAKRAHRFVDVLRRMELPDALDEAELTRLQNAIVAPEAQDRGYRTDTVYIGEQVDWTRQLIHFVAPRPEDVGTLMKGLLDCMARMNESGVEPLVQATVAAFGFVFIHPFQDGNGRIHRALIHHVLTKAGFTPPGLLLPVSAVLLRKRAEYDAALEAISKPMMRCIDYFEHEDGRLEVQNETADLYRFIDYTRLSEDLARWTEQTIANELQEELEFVSCYRKARARIEAQVDLPDRLLNTFIQVTLNDGGRLSKAKRGLFERLSDAQIAEMESAVAESFGELLRARQASR